MVRRAAAAAAASARLALLPVVMVRALVGRGVGVLVLLACLVLGSARRWFWSPTEMVPSPGCGWGECAPTAHRFALNVSYVHPGRLQGKEGLVHSLQRLQDVRMVCMV